MKKTITLALLSAMLLPYSANAQGVKFGKRYMKQRVEQRRQNAAKEAVAKAAKETAVLKASSDNILDEYEEKDGDRIFRYVYAYDKDNMRSSERIYMKEKTDGKWGAEKEITTGIYKYEYDSQKRLSVKTVTYTANDYFESYRVTVSYGDGITEYEKVELNEYGQADEPIERWSYYDNGVLASFTNYRHNSGTVSSTFDTDGVNTGYVFHGRKITFGGELNNAVVTYYDQDGWDDETQSYLSWKQTAQETYKYDASNGKLVEYTVDREYYDKKKQTYTYDKLGRLVAISEYGEAGDDVVEPGGDLNGDGVIDENDRPATSIAKTASTDATEWELDFEEAYTYLNDEVYGVGNSWHDVFGMDGPLTRIDVTEYGVESATIFNRDANGKLTSVTMEGNNGLDDNAKLTITVDGNGYVTKIEDEYSYDDGIYSDHTLVTMEYTWVNAEAIKAVYTEKREYKGPNDNYSEEWQETENYAYSDGKVTITKYVNNDETPESKTVIEENGANRRVENKKYNSYTEDDYIAINVQTEDVSFVRPNLAADLEGMTADSTIVVSVEGRVVCAYEGYWNTQLGLTSVDFDNMDYYVNTISGSTYFTVEHDGNETICRDIKGLPIYILTDGRLTKEYKYYEPSYGHGGTVDPQEPETAMRAASIPQGQAYDEITYVYDADGRLAGKTEVSVDEDGTRTEEIKLEYTYDETSGITSVEANAQVGVTLDGRRIGFSDNSAFSVYTIGGQVIAAGVTSYTFSSPGIYIVNAAGIKTKVSVK